jgi:hypothetical protein
MYRTLLEQKIKERRQTLEEFAEYVEKFARDHGEPGTLSVRHLQRLVAGRRSEGRPLGQPLPATARLLEHIFGVGIDELLTAPAREEYADDPIAEIRRKLHISSRVDTATVELLRDQLDAIRRLDRQLGAAIAHDEVMTKIDQVTSLFVHSLTIKVREQLAALLSEFLCLAGWQALDLGLVSEAWVHYNGARTAALQAPTPAYLGLAEAGRAFVLADAGEGGASAGLLTEVRRTIAPNCPPLVRSWLAAAHGEVLAANSDRTQSLRAFDRSNELLPSHAAEPGGPYGALNPVHLARWRGNALAKLADPEAVDVLFSALERLDSTFIRAETALRVDLTIALTATNEHDEAREQAHRARSLAVRIGSVRQQRRLRGQAAGYLGK